jgi:hypothetical protein
VEDERTRVCLDLNVFVAAEIAQSMGRLETTPLQLMDACREGRCDLIASWPMLEPISEA